jgi:hypothetical protein
MQELAHSVDERQQSAFKGTLIGKMLSDPNVAGEAAFSPSGAWAAYVERQPKSRCMVFVDERSSFKDEEFADVSAPAFSVDGRAVAYIGYRELTGKRRGLVSVAGELGQAFEGIKAPIFTSIEPATDAAQLSTEKPLRQSFLVLGIKAEPGSGLVAWKTISPGGTAWAYKEARGKDGPEKEFISLQEQLQSASGQKDADTQSLAFSGNPIFSADGSRVAFQAMRGEDVFVISGSILEEKFEISEAFRSISTLASIPSSSDFAYIGTRKNHSHVVAAGIMSEPFERIWPPFLFSPDGREIRFGIRSGQELRWELLSLEF